MKKISLLIIIPLLLFGCDDKNKTKTSGEATLNSELIFNNNTQTWTVPGFSFESGSVVLYNPAGGQTIPDIFAIPESDAHNNVTGAYLDTQNTFSSFAKVGEFSTIGEAQDFFNNYKQVDVSSFVGSANPVLENQVWVFKTRNEKYAKLLIVKVDAYLKDTDPFAEVVFKWAYQPDGSKILP